MYKYAYCTYKYILSLSLYLIHLNSLNYVLNNENFDHF